MTQLARSATLLILDGWNLGEPSATNAVYQAKTPFLDGLFERYAHCLIETSGRHVGLPDGQMGNSEVGHLNLGAGRIVDQDITRIDKAIETGQLPQNRVLADLLDAALKSGGSLHLLGLVSDGGVHSSLKHLEAMVRLAGAKGVPVRLHAFLDGRDTPPKSGGAFLRRVAAWETGCDFRIASVGGRYWGMDRDSRWDRVKKHWDTLLGCGPSAKSADEAVVDAYRAGQTDEFIEPVFIEEAGGAVQDGDAILFFNFRADRARQMTRAFTEADFSGFDRGRRPQISYACMTEYDADFDLPLAFPPIKLDGILADVMAKEGLRNLRLAETEKYAHVTFFFNGGVEAPWPGEDRVLIPSPDVATYDLQPEMSLPEVTAAYLERSSQYDVNIVNFANCDMLGHTGSLKAAIRGVEAVDRAVALACEAALDAGGFLVITADHGNAEQMWDDFSDSPHTAHTVSPVPLLLVDPAFSGQLAPGRLADVTPTLLAHAGLNPASHMTGGDLRR